MKRRMQLLIGGLLLLAGPLPHFAESYESEVGDFFPLEVGNRWVFQKYDVRYPETLWLEGTVSTEVVGQVQLKEHSYFAVRQDWNWYLPDTLYLRKEGSQIFRYIEQPDTVAFGISSQDRDRPDPFPLDPNQTDWLLYDFAAPQGSVWDLPLPEYWEPNPYVFIWWIFLNPSWAEPVPPNQRFFTFSATAYALGWDEEFEVGVGPVYITNMTTETEAWDLAHLKEAHIGGQTILMDQITSVDRTSWGQVKASDTGH